MHLFSWSVAEHAGQKSVEHAKQPFKNESLPNIQASRHLVASSTNILYKYRKITCKNYTRSQVDVV